MNPEADIEQKEFVIRCEALEAIVKLAIMGEKSPRVICGVLCKLLSEISLYQENPEAALNQTIGLLNLFKEKLREKQHAG